MSFLRWFSQKLFIKRLIPCSILLRDFSTNRKQNSSYVYCYSLLPSHICQYSKILGEVCFVSFNCCTFKQCVNKLIIFILLTEFITVTDIVPKTLDTCHVPWNDWIIRVLYDILIVFVNLFIWSHLAVLINMIFLVGMSAHALFVC